MQKRFLGNVLFDVDQEQKELRWVRSRFRGGRVLMATGRMGPLSTTKEAGILYSETCIVRKPRLCEERDRIGQGTTKARAGTAGGV